jgi:hypothetical protein
MFTSTRIALAGSLLLAALPSMSFAQDAASAPSLETRDSYLVVTRIDTRKCAYPMCGGYFVRAVNRATTRCADGSQQRECHAVQVNAQALGWSETQQAAFEAEFAKGRVIVRGSLEPAPAGLYTAEQLRITEAWQAQGPRNAMGSYYGVKSTGIVCITAPCPSLAATKLNMPAAPVLNPALDLSLSGATPARIQAGYAATGSGGLLAAGAVVPVSYPALEGRPPQKGTKLVASQFYLPAAY